ncbi:FecR domain-containing protein [Gemmata sp.]|uniref:FecR domain-containing protein n=1 Tax=Gemmata sp. TaxID=1914242 RepID=UPI003F700581
MSPDPRPSPELIDLVAAVADGLATPEDEARLAALLRADPAARAYYLDHTSLVAELQWEYAGVAADLPAPAPPVVPVRRVPTARRVLVYAASLCAAALVGVFAASAWGPGRVTAASEPPHAVLVRGEGVKWGGPGPRTGAAVPTGPVRLDAGVIDLKFASGAAVRVAGPAEFEVLSGRAIDLKSGRASVRCDEGATGFRLRTAEAEFVDLGTEFAVVVADDGSAEVRVAEGVVVARSLASEVVVPLHAGEAARVEARTGEVHSTDADPARFRVGPPPAPVPVPAPQPVAAFGQLPPGARVVFLGDQMTDRETHILLANQALGTLPGRPLLLNGGECLPLFFAEADVAAALTPLRPTHAVVEFGSEAASYDLPSTPDEFRAGVARLLDRLAAERVTAIIELGHPLGRTRPPADHERLDEYNRHLRSLAAARSLRVIDPAPRFRAAEETGATVVTPNGRSPTFVGCQLLAATVLEGLGYPNLAIPSNVKGEMLPGAVRDWQVRIVPAGERLTARTAAALRPGDGWRGVSIPMPPDPLQLRMADQSHYAASRERLLGFVTGLPVPAGGGVQAIASLDAPRARAACVNLGGSVRAVWLNGEKVFEHSEIWHGWHAGKERIPVKLVAGRNHLVVEAGNHFFLSVTDAADWALPFPSPE